ncbi:MAG: T9SS type A sorting domain-containing protein, partial [Fibrobacterota bacterium]
HDSTMTDLIVSGATTDTSYTLHRLSDNTLIFWRVKARNKVGESNFSVPVVFRTAFPAIPKYSLSKFNFYQGFGHLSYSVAKQSDVVIRLFNLRGKLVWKTKNRSVNPGYYSETMPSSALPAGYYIVKIKAGTFTKSAGTTLVK